jgi:hypothetical protein
MLVVSDGRERIRGWATASPVCIAMADFENEVVYPKSVADERGAVLSASFISCRIEGPAVIQAIGCRFRGCRFGFVADIEPMLWEIPEGPRIGAFMFGGCSFNDCVFVGIGFAGDRASLNTFKGWVIEGP